MNTVGCWPSKVRILDDKSSPTSTRILCPKTTMGITCFLKQLMHSRLEPLMCRRHRTIYNIWTIQLKRKIAILQFQKTTSHTFLSSFARNQQWQSLLNSLPSECNLILFIIFDGILPTYRVQSKDWNEWVNRRLNCLLNWNKPNVSTKSVTPYSNPFFALYVWTQWTHSPSYRRRTSGTRSLVQHSIL